MTEQERRGEIAVDLNEINSENLCPHGINLRYADG